MIETDVTPTEPTEIKITASDMTSPEGELPTENKPEIEPSKRCFILKPGFAFNPWTKWPRNLACVCGSGAKFKYCHEGKLSHAIPSNVLTKANDEFAKSLKFVSDLKKKGVNYKMAPKVDEPKPTVEPTP